MPEDFHLWHLLFNYVPFKVQSLEDRIFHLAVSHESDNCIHFNRPSQTLLPSNQPRTLSLPSEDGTTCFALFPGDSVPPVASLRLTNGATQGHLSIYNTGPSYIRFAVDTALMLQFAFVTSMQQTLLLHASSVVHNQKSYAFLGKSGTGKSTHSTLWLDHIPNTVLLNDDNPVLRIIDGCPMLFGSPWSGKTPCYKQTSARLAGMVRLIQSSTNRITRLPLLESYLALGSSTSAFHLRTNNHPFLKSVTDNIHNTLHSVIQSTPIYSLHCLPNADAALLCHEIIARNIV